MKSISKPPREFWIGIGIVFGLMIVVAIAVWLFAEPCIPCREFAETLKGGA